jgi:AcrR family transcriptional regulator
MSVTEKNPWEPSRRKRDTRFPIKREAVLNAAAALFRERGYEGTSLNDLADILNITKPTVYYYIQSKEQLLLDILNRAQDHILGFLKAAEISPMTGYEKLRTVMIKYALIMISDEGACIARVPTRVMEPDSRANVEARIKEADEIIYRILACGEQDGTLRPADPLVVNHALFGSLNWMAYWTRPQGRLSPEQLAEMQVDLLLDGVRGPVASRPAKAKVLKRTTSAVEA